MHPSIELAMQHLIKSTEGYVAPLNKFRDIALVPWGKRGRYYSEDCLVAYERAVEAMREWVKMILSAEVMIVGTTNTSCKLLLLEGKYLSQSVDYKFEGECNRKEDYVLITPIGMFSAFMYRAIMEIPNNPVKMFYETICKAVEKLRDYDSAWSCEFAYSDRYLVRGYIKEYDDCIGVCDFDVIAESIKEFLNPKRKKMIGNGSMYHFI